MNHPTILDIILLLLTGLTAVYLVWRFWQRWGWEKQPYVWYYIMAFVVLFVSGVLLIFLGYDILGTPFVLTVASLIPLGLSMGIAEQYFQSWKKQFKWFATVGFLAIAVTSFAGWEMVRKIAVPLFHGIAGLVIFLGPFFAKNSVTGAKPANGFWWVGVGGGLIGIGGIALAFLSMNTPLLGIFTPELVYNILALLLFLMTMAFAWGFVKDIKN
ncbi:MAG: hypothetical protein JXA13_08710 [Anaerolineales bacterium]|nr:hypothetical protein [Anaerolineales bacterium]